MLESVSPTGLTVLFEPSEAEPVVEYVYLQRPFRVELTSSSEASSSCTVFKDILKRLGRASESNRNLHDRHPL